MNGIHSNSREHSSIRKLTIKVLTLIFPLFLLFLIEVGLRIFSYGDNLKLFVPIPREGYEQYRMVNPIVGKKYFQNFQYDSPPNDIFLKKKPEGTFRIFVMGSSTVVGFPYGNNLMFSRILHKRLEEAFPLKNIEVVNTAITAINSFTLADYAKQIAAWEPDAVLIYAGHNEFYGAFGAGSKESMSKGRTLTRIHLQLMDRRLYQLIRNIGTSTIGKMKGGKSEQVKGTLMKRIVAERSISLDSETYQQAMKRYRQNMEFVLSTFSKRELPVFLSQVISNVKDIAPLSALSTGTEDVALVTYKKANLAYHQGNYEVARDLYIEAKDQDGVRFRASEEVNRIIHELALKFELNEVPMINYFEEQSPHGIIGATLLTEHVHPNITGNFIMADAFFTEIVKSDLLQGLEKKSLHSSKYHQLNWGYTLLDTLRAHHMITNLTLQWPFVPVDAESRDYRTSYHPVSEVDSIAFMSMADPSKSLADRRLELAKKYEGQGKHKEAFAEFNAFLYTNPYIAVNYRDAASSLIWLADLPLALHYFEKSLAIEPSFYAHYRVGEIYLIKGDYSSAGKSFESAFSLATDEDEKIKTIGKLYMAAAYGGQEKSAQALAAQLKKYDAARYLKIPPNKYTYLNYVPFQTRAQVNKALQLRSELKLDEALTILKNSLKIYDSHVARRYIGEICLQEGKMEVANIQFDRVYEEFRFDPTFMKLYNSLN
ncbi:MAG: hypothetical protein QNK35_13320 [Bacteroides sp.]|nr:hypothetical protein [Bacteroides sp.]